MGKRPVESRRRSLLKSVIYRLATVFVLDFGIIYLSSGDLTRALGFSLLIELAHGLFYYVYERVWSNIKWGYKYNSGAC